MNDLKDRFQKLADYYGLSIRKLEQKLNLQRGNISNTTGSIGSDKLSNIYDSASEINLVWLITGKGRMINDNTIVIDPNNPTTNLLLERIEKLAADKARLEDELTAIKQQKKYRDLIQPDIAAEPELKPNNPDKNK